ncbi:hypothetical protein GE061_010147 [Apolygus lucorum]|uniref:Suppressor of cytokine signaling 4 n=1 Tax=Apolygus lucorum TaxID=248454 RepID=A0A6A4KJ29_APOLU|nr:hypothetical protein GE061_010147 [Apolygus lucorum]
MGQKISDLKGVLGIMEDRGVNEIRISVESLGLCLDREDDNGNHRVGSSNSREQAAAVSRTSTAREENGNDAGSSVTPSTSSGASSKKSRSKRKKKKSPHWVLRFNCARLKSGSGSSGAGSEPDIAEPNVGLESCVCTGYRRTDDHHLGASVVFERRPQAPDGSSDSEEEVIHEPLWETLNLKFNNLDEYSIDDCDERARIERAREIAEGVDPPPGFRPGQHIQLLCVQDMNIDSLTALLHNALSQLDTHRVIHTQVDYIHCLVPDLLQITSCSYYWGKMDRYEAERLLEGKPEGTFLLRDSAQEEYLFSVSFRKYDRSLHARIEQWKHLFSFDSHDPGVYSSPTVCGLIEHYKDPSCCMYFEPTLTIPLHRNFAFPLQHLARSVICSNISYDGVSQLRLPKSLKAYLKEYHYKQRVKVRRFDNE